MRDVARLPLCPCSSNISLLPLLGLLCIVRHRRNWQSTACQCGRDDECTTAQTSQHGNQGARVSGCMSFGRRYTALPQYRNHRVFGDPEQVYNVYASIAILCFAGGIVFESTPGRIRVPPCRGQAYDLCRQTDEKARARAHVGGCSTTRPAGRELKKKFRSGKKSKNQRAAIVLPSMDRTRC